MDMDADKLKTVGLLKKHRKSTFQESLSFITNVAPWRIQLNWENKNEIKDIKRITQITGEKQDLLATVA